jgi:hypothetical protein
VIHPLLLYQTKGINLAGIDQQREESQRQDAKQFTIMGIVVAELLREFATTSGDERALVKSAGRLLEFALTKEGAALVRAGAMDPMKLLPLRLMKAHADGSVRMSSINVCRISDLSSIRHWRECRQNRLRKFAQILRGWSRN